MNSDNKKFVDLKTLESWLKEGANILRGRDEGLKYIITLLFYKRLCDVFDDEIEALKSKFSTLEEKEVLKLAREEKLVPFYIPEESHFQTVRKTTTNLGERLTEALRKIAKENSELQGVIDIIDFNETRYSHGERIRVISDDTLSQLLEIFNKHTIGLDEAEPDVLGRAYEYLLRLYAEGKGKTAGEFYTPREVAFLMAYCVDPKEGESVYDPACGSGGFLIKAHLVLREKLKNQGKEIEIPLRLYGQEIDATTFALAKINMFIHNIETTDIRLGDTLLNPRFIENGKLKKFNIVLANPMWNQKGYSEGFCDSDPYERFNFGYVGGPKGKSSFDWGWVQHMFASLKEDGRMAVVLDTGSVSRGTGKNKDKEKAVRQKFVDNDFIEAVLLLPENLFYNTGAPGIILFVRRRKPEERKGKILLINASKEFIKGKPKNYLSEENIKKIVDVYKNFKEVEKFSKIITLEEARKADYNLSPSRFVSVWEEEKYRDIGKIFGELKKIEETRQKIEEKLKKILEKL